jgi:hypothetical protein
MASNKYDKYFIRGPKAGETRQGFRTVSFFSMTTSLKEACIL